MVYGTFLINISRYNYSLGHQTSCNFYMKYSLYNNTLFRNTSEVWNRRMYWKTITIACIYPAFFSLRYFDLVSKANYNLENTNIYIIVFPIQEFQRKDMSSSVDTNEKKLYFTSSYIFLTIFLLPKIENEIVFAFRTIIEFI